MLGYTLQAIAGGQSRPGPQRAPYHPSLPQEWGSEGQAGFSRKARGNPACPVTTASAGGLVTGCGQIQVEG